MMSSEAFQKTLTLGVNTIADIGCGRGLHSLAFCNKGMSVHGFDIVKPQIQHENFTFRGGLFPPSDHYFTNYFDCVWLSHVLEHVLDVHTLRQLEKLKIGQNFQKFWKM